MENVTGVILAGGYGKRLMPLTEKIPKPLLEISKDYTILDKQLEDFGNIGVKEVYLLIGHLGDQIKKRYGSSYNGIKIRYLEEEKPMGTLWAISNALMNVKTDVLVRNGDNVSDHNFKEFIDYSRKSNDPITITVTKMISPFGVIETSDNKVISFKEKPELNILINAGIYYIKKEAFPYFQKKYYKKNFEQTVLPDLAEERKIGYYKEDGVFWIGVDGHKDLETTKKEFENKEIKPWGYEKNVVNNEKYLVKELYIKKGFQTSLHSHPNKDESMHIQEGEGYIDFGNKKELIAKGNVIRIKPKTKHTIIANKNLRIFEYSTPHPKDTVRIKDFYGRK